MNSAHPLDHPNLVVVHFSPYAGGKFWINCLAHHSLAMPLLTDLNDRHWSMFNLEDDLRQRLKLELINKTLPPPEELHNWRKYELGHIAMWGDSLPVLLEPQGYEKINRHALNLLNQYRCFIIDHGVVSWEKGLATLPHARHVFLINSAKFQARAAELKAPGDNHESLIFPESLPNVFYVNVDDTWFDVNITDYKVRQCLSWLGLEDEPMPGLQPYIENYFNLHR